MSQCTLLLGNEKTLESNHFNILEKDLYNNWLACFVKPLCKLKANLQIKNKPSI